MARSPTASDAFGAIAEARRREILDALAADTGGVAGEGGGRDVTWLVEELGWPQPLVSKHLAVLREAGLVSVVRKGRRRVYSLDGERLRSVFEWVKAFEPFWDHQLRRVKARAERLERESRLRGRPSGFPQT